MEAWAVCSAFVSTFPLLSPFVLFHTCCICLPFSFKLWCSSTWDEWVALLLHGIEDGCPHHKTSFGCSRIYIDPRVLRWVGVELELNSTPIHSNTCGLRSIQQHPNKA